MIVFQIMLAGQCIEIHTEHKSYPDYFSGYCLPEDNRRDPDHIVQVEPADIEREKSYYRIQCGLSENAPAERSDYAFEMTALYRKITTFLLKKGTIIMHGSAIGVNGQSILFSAPSGVGKSTHVSYWKEVYGDRVTVINDDKPLIRTDDCKCIVCGSPWSGAHHLHRNIEMPLKAICFLERGETNEVIPLSATAALPRFMQAVNRPADHEDMDDLMAAITRIVRWAKFFMVRCVNDSSAAGFAYKALFQEQLK